MICTHPENMVFAQSGGSRWCISCGRGLEPDIRYPTADELVERPALGITHEQEPYDPGECQHEWALWCPKCSHVTYPPPITGAGAIAQPGIVSTVTGEMVERGLTALLERHPQIYQAIKTSAPAVSVRQAVRDILEAALKPQE